MKQSIPLNTSCCVELTTDVKCSLDTWRLRAILQACLVVTLSYILIVFSLKQLVLSFETDSILWRRKIQNTKEYNYSNIYKLFSTVLLNTFEIFVWFGLVICLPSQAAVLNSRAWLWISVERVSQLPWVYQPFQRLMQCSEQSWLWPKAHGGQQFSLCTDGWCSPVFSLLWVWQGKRVVSV